MFDDFNLTEISTFATKELLIGIVAGIVFKQAAKLKARQDVDCQILSPNEYTSIGFKSGFPKHFADAFLLPPEFVIFKSSNGIVVSEEFITFLGAFSKFIYENGVLKGGTSSALTYPVYLMTVLIPILIGFVPSFFSSVFPSAGSFFPSLLYSGFIWMFLTFSIQTLVGKLRQASE
jgi:hypothetical protein